MKNPLPAQKVGNRSGIGARGRTGNVTPKAGRRGREADQTIASRVRTVLAYAPGVIKVMLVIVTGVVVFLGYRAAASASFFQIRKVETRGIARASAETIETAVRQDVKATGVWRADLTEISSHLEQLPWVRTAVVTRQTHHLAQVRFLRTRRVPSQRHLTDHACT